MRTLQYPVQSALRWYELSERQTHSYPGSLTSNLVFLERYFHTMSSGAFMVRNVTILLFAVVTSIAFGQKQGMMPRNPADFVSSENDAVRIFVNKRTGQFWLERFTGERLLFAGADGGSSASNVRFNGATFTNNDIHSPQTPAQTLGLPLGNAVLEGDTIVFRTVVLYRERQLDIEQRFIPLLESTYGYMRVITKMRNRSAEPVPVGLQQLYDAYLYISDAPQIEMSGAIVQEEREWQGNAIPDQWTGSLAGIPEMLIGRLRDSGTTTPDRIYAGNWQYNGYLGAPYWNYMPSGIRLGADRALLLQWDEEMLLPGAERTIVTDYGVSVNAALALDCRWELLGGSEKPLHYLVISQLRNKGSIALHNVEVEIDLPSGLALAPGESKKKSLVTPLLPGASMPVSWNLRCDSASVPKIMPVTVRGGNSLASDSCQLDLDIPIIAEYSMATVCDQPVRMQLTQDGLAYLNNPFVVEARVRNNGNVPVSGTSAQIGYSSRLQLMSPSDVAFLTPDPLPPGQEGVVSFQLYAIPQKRDTTVQYVIELIRSPFYRDSCVVSVTLPATLTPRCKDNGVLTKGTLFHAALPGNNASTTGDYPLAVLYICADSTASVQVTDHLTGRLHSFTVLSGEMERVILSNRQLVPAYERDETRTFTVSSSSSVSVIAGSLQPRHSDATLILPDHALGKEYYSVGYDLSPSVEAEEFAVAATEDNTEVTVVPYSRTSTGIPGSQPFQFNLDEGHDYTFVQGVGGPFGGLTGSRITANKPVAVVGGMNSGYIPHAGSQLQYLNPAMHQVYPIEALGTEYVIVPFRSRLNGYTFRIVGIYPGTTLRVDGGTPMALSPGEKIELQRVDPAVITASQPVLIAQYANSASFDFDVNEYGDASMVVLTPVDRYASCNTFPVRIGSFIDTIGERYTDSFVNLVAFDGGQTTVTVNGIAVPDTAFHRIPNTQYWWASLRLDGDYFAVGTTDMRGVGAVVYGFEYHDAFSFVPAYRSGASTTHLEGIPEEAVVLLDVAPNPVNQGASISVRSLRPLKGRICLIDMLGRIVSETPCEIDRGRQQLHIDTSSYPAGLYSVQFVSGERRYSVPMFIAH